MEGKYFYFVCFLIVGCLVAGCVQVSRTDVGVSAFSVPEAQEKQTYTIAPTMTGVTKDDFLYLECKEELVKALSQKGFREVTSMNDADIFIAVYYSKDNGTQKSGGRSIPIFGQSGTTTTSATYSGQQYGSQTYGNVNYNTMPTFGITGYSNKTYSYTTYSKYLELTAYDLKLFRKTGAEKKLWRISGIINDKKNDLRASLPVLITGMEPYFATNTGKLVNSEVRTFEKKEKIIRMEIVD